MGNQFNYLENTVKYAGENADDHHPRKNNSHDSDPGFLFAVHFLNHLDFIKQITFQNKPTNVIYYIINICTIF